MFERRLGLFPVFFDRDGEMHVYTGFGDFPFKIPAKKINGPEDLFPGWMLLSYNKPTQVSSELLDHPKAFAADEEIRTYWSAQTGNKGEWISMNLQKESTIHAIQINFAEHNTTLMGRGPDIYYQYLLEYSTDNKTWKTLTDKTQNKTDVPHDYIELKAPIKARFLRLTNYKVPDGTFALAGLRIFGVADVQLPAPVKNINSKRQDNDRCVVKLNWTKSDGALGYNIRYGIAKDKLYHTYQVLGVNTLTINSLNSFQKYYFTIDAFNEKGITKSGKIEEMK